MRIAALLLLLFPSAWNLAQAAESLTRMEWKVEGTAREALVYLPPAAKTAPCPVVFAFHGHGGTMRHAAVTLAIISTGRRPLWSTCKA